MSHVQNLSVGVKRDPYWDALKFILIFLVVYGHIVPFADYSRFKVAAFNFVYLFHMPLFVFISGRFSQVHDRKRYMRSIWRFLETLLVFQILYVVLLGQWDIKYLMTPNFHLWYLLSLVFWRLMLYYLPERWLSHRGLVLVVCFVVSLSAGFINVGEPLSLQRTLTLLPFFMLGYYSYDVDFKKYNHKIPFLVAGGALLAVFCLFFFVLQESYSYVFYGSIPYWTDNWPETFTRFLYRGLFLPSAIVMSVLVMRVVPAWKTFAKWGSATLFVYVYHPLIVLGFLEPATANGLIPKNDFMLLVYAIIITALLVFLSRFKVLQLLMNPSDWIRRRAS